MKKGRALKTKLRFILKNKIKLQGATLYFYIIHTGAKNSDTS